MTKYEFYMQKKLEAESNVHNFQSPLLKLFYRNAAKGFEKKARSLSVEEAKKSI